MTIDAEPPADVLDRPGEVIGPRTTQVGGVPVHRTLPRRVRRMVGAWCLLDHFGPTTVEEATMQVAPHPHIGLATVTWLLAGELVHRDSLGNEQRIRPGHLNVMSAGFGISHSEETPPAAGGTLEGLQLWLAQPDATRSRPPAFEHHAALERVRHGEAVSATVLLGEHAGSTSPARADSPVVGVDLQLHGGGAVLPLDPTFEHAVLVTRGVATVQGRRLGRHRALYLRPGTESVHVTAPAGSRALLIGGLPFDAPVLMWWNFVARSSDEIERAHADWEARSSRFGTVDSRLRRVPAPPPPWSWRD